MKPSRLAFDSLGSSEAKGQNRSIDDHLQVFSCSPAFIRSMGSDVYAPDPAGLLLNMYLLGQS
jgi:hypothetical protein